MVIIPFNKIMQTHIIIYATNSNLNLNSNFQKVDQIELQHTQTINRRKELSTARVFLGIFPSPKAFQNTHIYLYVPLKVKKTNPYFRFSHYARWRQKTMLLLVANSNRSELVNILKFTYRCKHVGEGPGISD